MYCNQCEQTTQSPLGAGCTIEGVCGKSSKAAVLQDLLIYASKGMGMYLSRARILGRTDAELDSFLLSTLFTTLTNVNFDERHLARLVKKASVKLRQSADLYKEACSDAPQPPEALVGPAEWTSPDDVDAMLKQGEMISMLNKRGSGNEDIDSLKYMLLYGIKGMAAYAHHAEVLGKTDEEVYATVEKGLDALTKTELSIDELLAWVLKIGEMNYRGLELLDEGHTEMFGHPEPTEVCVTPIKGKAILVSGHDLKDLEALLKQTEGKGINVFTHGEMLPAHGYPKLKAYPHLVGNYGGAWQDQQIEFANFPGAVLMTSNCLQEPMPNYEKRIFTTGPVGWEGISHIDDGDFSAVIAAANASKGFQEDIEDKQMITVGFARNAVLGVADKVIDAVKAGDIKHFYLIGGCDGAKTGRDYFTDFANEVPKDSVILTLGCGKYRFNKQEFGDISGIPRLLDVGQCNDSYSAVQIALALASAFECEVNDLPLSLVISWFEQKAVAVLLTLLHLGIKNIYLGPTLPAFVSPNVLNVLVEKFALKPTTVAKSDLDNILVVSE